MVKCSERGGVVRKNKNNAIKQARYSVTFCVSAGNEGNSAPRPLIFEGAKWNRMYQVYEQKKRLPQTSIEELKGH